jgi:hypothetical protein
MHSHVPNCKNPCLVDIRLQPRNFHVWMTPTTMTWNVYSQQHQLEDYNSGGLGACRSTRRVYCMIIRHQLSPVVHSVPWVRLKLPLYSRDKYHCSELLPHFTVTCTSQIKRYSITLFVIFKCFLNNESRYGEICCTNFGSRLEEPHGANNLYFESSFKMLSVF